MYMTVISIVIVPLKEVGGVDYVDSLCALGGNCALGLGLDLTGAVRNLTGAA